MDNQKLVSNIKDECLKQNYSIMQLEEDIHVSHGLISRWSKPNGNPPLEKIIEIAKLLNVSIIDLIDEESKENPTTNENVSYNIVDENILLINKIYNMKWRVYDYNNMSIDEFNKVINDFNNDTGCISIEPYFLIHNHSYLLLLAGYLNYTPIIYLYLLENKNIYSEKLDVSSDSLLDLWMHIRNGNGILEKISKLKNTDLKKNIINE